MDIEANKKLSAIADLLVDYLAGIEYKPGNDESLDKIINLLNIEFSHGDFDDLYWYSDL